MGLKVKKEVDVSTVIFHLKGILDISTSNVIEPYLDNIHGIEILIIDFSGIEFIDSTGIGSIINIIHLSLEKSFKVKLQGIDEETNQVFEMVGLYDILEAIQGEVVLDV